MVRIRRETWNTAQGKKDSRRDGQGKSKAYQLHHSCVESAKARRGMVKAGPDAISMLTGFCGNSRLCEGGCLIADNEREADPKSVFSPNRRAQTGLTGIPVSPAVFRVSVTAPFSPPPDGDCGVRCEAGPSLRSHRPRSCWARRCRRSRLPEPGNSPPRSGRCCPSSPGYGGIDALLLPR